MKINCEIFYYLGWVEDGKFVRLLEREFKDKSLDKIKQLQKETNKIYNGKLEILKETVSREILES